MNRIDIADHSLAELLASFSSAQGLLFCEKLMVTRLSDVVHRLNGLGGLNDDERTLAYDALRKLGFYCGEIDPHPDSRR